MRRPAGRCRRATKGLLLGLVLLLATGCDVGPEDAPLPLPPVPSPAGDPPSPTPSPSR